MVTNVLADMAERRVTNSRLVAVFTEESQQHTQGSPSAQPLSTAKGKQNSWVRHHGEAQEWLSGW
ncbi:hypothetical protein E2C01_074141 [Portunus trituberculatus]|uniref:Uncharacterized protein n=1 Tax=Portunus trituberculatus TaxID=210409 RepID=A0A5B7IBL4_PORTR|nr:hypothetical protein [Portunus trituberculatus]